ncbi:hypothetical protein NSK_007887 [Nannochloropsis salina CCMP1776]|uniref:Multiple myeloma tumor-associated protein 2-like N-terminal domain-containing protein n=1 Tax=Nannochloropsis salina CCMP1776 TaxID=1027361 RepID=A0A4D9CNJ9_9STRA|nr:hypothetical protein NSK_007887 [Nannochloropsis salina CCMP1776]|eukprot:TFJ80710.1 hypothetical protein NSK_007887 [Nannochloropsis salina CCMP1776]
MSFGPKTGYRDGGTRGGQDRFKWEDVKDEHYREHYLGHSLKAPVGRWQKGKDLIWYTKAGKVKSGEAEDPEAQRQREVAEIRRRDEEMINAALGMAPKYQAVVESRLEASELKQLLGKGLSERDDLHGERVEGVGAAPAPRHEHLPKGLSMVEREIERMKSAQAQGVAFKYEDDATHLYAEQEAEGGGHTRAGNKRKDSSKRESLKEYGGSTREEKKLKKEEKRRKKEEKRERKQDKKRQKKEKILAVAEEAMPSRHTSRPARNGRSRSPDQKHRRQDGGRSCSPAHGSRGRRVH